MEDSIVKSIKDEFDKRSKIGYKKYKKTLDRDDLSDIEWLQHAKEEAMDLVLYLQKIINKLSVNNIT